MDNLNNNKEDNSEEIPEIYFYDQDEEIEHKVIKPKQPEIKKEPHIYNKDSKIEKNESKIHFYSEENHFKSDITIKKRSSKKLSIIIISICIIILGIIFSFRSSYIKIQGKVFDSNNSEIVLTGASITLDDKKIIENNSLNGGFFFSKVPKGQHKIKVYRKGYMPYEKSLYLTSDIKLNIPLKSNSNVIQKSSFKLAVNSNNSIILIEPENSNKETNIEIGDRPSDFVLLNEKQKMYVSRPSQGILSVIDMTTNSELKKISFDKQYQLTKLNLSPDKNILYVLAIAVGKIFLIDTNTDQVKSSFDVDFMTSDFNVDITSGNLIVLDNSKISILNNSGVSIKEHKFVKGDFYEKLILDSSNTIAYVIHSVNSNLVQVDLNSNTENIFNLKEKVKDIIVDDNNSLLYVLYDSSLDVFKKYNLEPYKTDILTGGQRSNSLYKYKDSIYIVNMESNNISVFDSKSLEMKKDLIPAGQSPKKLIIF